VIPVAELSDVLPQSDIVLDLLPLTPATGNFFNRERFGLMKPGSLFVNLGRGATVVDAALIKAIDDGIVRYAALDVFRDEPLPDQHPFWTHPRILLTPHIGGLMPDYWGAVADIFIENMKRFEQGSELLNIVDKEKGY
jgi:phosphoglycerate dehydrogenase-like enzyme